MMRPVSPSQAAKFRACQLAWHAEYVQGWYRPEATDAMLAGSYLHAMMLDADKGAGFGGEHPEIYRYGNPAKGIKAAFEWCEMAERASYSHPGWRDLLEGDHEVELEWELGGTPWRGRLDVLNRETGVIADIKRCRSIHEECRAPGPDPLPWTESRFAWVPWWEARRYHWQMATYVEGAMQNGIEVSRAYILAVSGETPPAFAIIEFVSEGKLALALEDATILGQQIAASYDLDEDEVYACEGRYEACEVCRARLGTIELEA